MNRFKRIFSDILILTPYLFLFSGLAIIKDGDKRMVVITLISIIVSLVVYKLDVVKKNLHNKFLWVVFLLTFYVSAQYYFQGFSPNLIRSFICASLFLLCFPLQLLTNKNITYLLVLGSCFLLANSSYYTFYLGLTRDTGLVNAIPYATLAATITLFSLHNFIINTKTSLKLFSFLSFSFSLVCVVLSLTRGIWIALLVAIIMLLTYHAYKKRQLVKYSLITLLALTLISFAFKGPIIKRTEQTKNEFSRIQSGDLNSSIGLRIQMWKSSIQLSKKDFWFGLGKEHQIYFQELGNKGEITKALANIQPQHYHNQILDYLVKAGIFGVILLMMIFLVPIIHAIKTPTPNSILIFSIVCLYFIAGLTDVPFNHAETILMYLMMITPLCALKQHE